MHREASCRKGLLQLEIKRWFSKSVLNVRGQCWENYRRQRMRRKLMRAWEQRWFSFSIEWTRCNRLTDRLFSQNQRRRNRQSSARRIAAKTLAIRRGFKIENESWWTREDGHRAGSRNGETELKNLNTGSRERWTETAVEHADPRVPEDREPESRVEPHFIESIERHETIEREAPWDK